MRIATALVALSASFIVGCGPAAAPQQSTGGSAPDFTVETFEGRSFSLAEQKGTPVVLNFWESW